MHYVQLHLQMCAGTYGSLIRWLLLCSLLVSPLICKIFLFIAITFLCAALIVPIYCYSLKVLFDFRFLHYNHKFGQLPDYHNHLL